jgi:hypothetical protein
MGQGASSCARIYLGNIGLERAGFRHAHSGQSGSDPSIPAAGPEPGAGGGCADALCAGRGWRPCQAFARLTALLADKFGHQHVATGVRVVALILQKAAGARVLLASAHEPVRAHADLSRSDR